MKSQEEIELTFQKKESKNISEFSEEEGDVVYKGKKLFQLNDSNSEVFSENLGLSPQFN